MSKRTICLISPIKENTGNLATASRIHLYLEKSSLTSCHDPGPPPDAQLYIILHAWRSAAKLALRKDKSAPYIVIFGGTDVNEFWKEPSKLETMIDVTHNALRCIAFSTAMAEKAKKNLQLKYLPIVIPQAVPNYTPATEEKSSDRGRTFLWLGGLRKVKAPSFLLPVINKLNGTYIVAGPEMEPNMADFLRGPNAPSNARYLGKQSHENAIDLIRKCTVVVNTSISEGLSQTILESMIIGKPVLARDNEGNRSIVDDGKTGWLYNTPEDFLKLANSLTDEELRRAGRAGRDKALYQFSVGAESVAYNQLVEAIFCGDVQYKHDIKGSNCCHCL